ncbi:MAG: FG-GAP-like repeat-containing protein [Gemmataceae bacterium]
MSKRVASPRRHARLTVEALERRCVPALFSSVELSTLPTTPNVGFALNGFTDNDATASYVRGIGDVNGDGIDDLAVGSPGPNLGGPGQVYVVFGRPASFGTGLNLNQLDGAVGFTINGPDSGTASRMSAAGDVNGDGIGDLLVGAPGAKTAPAFVPGKAYVIFGKATGFPAVLNLDSFTAADGMVVVGADHGGKLGDSVAGVGDVNSDGIDDILIGAPGMAPDGPAFKGKAFVVFGSRSGLPASITTTALDGSNGFKMNGVAQFDATGTSVARAGDVNGDGKNDLLIGATGTGTGGNLGKVFVVYGGGPFAASLELSALNGANGFVITAAGSQIGRAEALAGGGDFNGDGRPDIAIGSWNANGGGLTRGAAYLVYGRSGSTFPATYPLSSLSPDQGTTVFGSINGGQLGTSVAFVDFNNDGVSDLLTGAPIANHFNSNNGAFSGIVYVVFGRRGNNGGGEVDVLNSQGYSFEARGFGSFSNAGRSVASAGDINHDGAADLILGMPNPLNPSDKRPGRAFVLYGKFGRPAAQMLGSGGLIRGGGLAYEFKLSFANSTPINVSTLGAANVVVVGPNGQPVAAQYVGYDAVTETATYRVTPADGVWDFRDNGDYAIHIAGNQVFDIFGNAVPGAFVGHFVVSAVPKVIAVGTNVGGRVQVFTPDGTPMFTIDAFPATTGGVRVAVGDVNADGIPDVIATPGGGVLAEVKVFDGRDGSPLAGYTPIRPYGPAWVYGAYVAAADVDGAPGAEIVVGPGRGSILPVVAFKATGQVVSRFRAYGTNIVGGVRVAAGNLLGDARAEIVTAAGSGVSIVKAFTQAGRPLWARQAYALAGGVFVTVGDVNGDGLNEVVTGPEGPNQPYLRVYRGFNGLPVPGQVAAYPPNFFLGSRVGVLDVDGDGRLEVLVSTAGARTVLVYSWVTKRRVDSFATFEAAYGRGLFVAGG